MSLIACSNAAFRYDGREVVAGLNFTVEPGDYLCIVGENGSGKSTLVKGLLGLKAPSDGTITLGDGLHQREIGYLPQQRETRRDFPASVYEVALSGTLNALGTRPFYGAAERRTALEQLKKVGMDSLKSACFGELSGGQQQRVLLARALCAAQKLLILDEPTAGLDPLASAELYQLIDELNRAGVSIVMVSHDIRAAVEHASRILHLENRPLFYGTAAAYAKSELGQSFLNGVGCYEHAV